jgi:hypothetical protein
LNSFKISKIKVLQKCKVNRRKKKTIAEAMSGEAWIKDLMHNVTPDILAEYIPLWMVIDGISFEPTDPRPDEIVWTRTASGEYTTSSAYQMQFQGSVESNFKALIWQVWAPSRCKFFCLVNASESSMDSRQVSPTPMAK